MKAAKRKTTKYKSDSQITASGSFYKSWRGRKSLALSLLADSRATKSCNKYNIRSWVIYWSQDGVLHIRLTFSITFTAASFSCRCCASCCRSCGLIVVSRAGLTCGINGIFIRPMLPLPPALRVAEVSNNVNKLAGKLKLF